MIFVVKTEWTKHKQNLGTKFCLWGSLSIQTSEDIPFSVHVTKLQDYTKPFKFR